MRSILFVPATREDLIGKACKGEAAAICVDLEDGVAPDQKSGARANVAAALDEIVRAGKRTMLRINAGLDAISFDLAVVPASLEYIVLPMAGSRHQILQLAAWADNAFGSEGPKIVAMVENAEGLRSLATDIRHLPARLTHFVLGSEDFAASQGCHPGASPIRNAFDQLAHLAAETGVGFLGYPGSIAEFRNLALFEENVEKGRDAGAIGGFAIHPKQVDVLNRVFTPPDAEIVQARQIVEAFEAALSEGRGAIQLEGRMIDRPVYLAAQRLLTRV